MKIVITDKVHKLLIDGLVNDGHEVVYDTSIDMHNLAEIIPNVDGIIINSKIKMHKEMIDAGEKLRFIGRLGSGMEIVDVPYAQSKNIQCINTPDGNCDAVAEHAIGMILAFSNNLIRANEQTKNLEWYREANRGFEIMGKTMGIIGVGHTGGALAKKLSGFDMKILGYDKYKKTLPEELSHVEFVKLEDIQKEADIISFHLPLSDETKHFANQDFLQKSKKGVILVNTSRGSVIDTKAMIKLLESGHIGGACLDVFENEKPATYTEEEVKMYRALGQMQNTILSPHVAGWTHESLARIASLMLERIKNVY